MCLRRSQPVRGLEELLVDGGLAALELVPLDLMVLVLVLRAVQLSVLRILEVRFRPLVEQADEQLAPGERRLDAVGAQVKGARREGVGGLEVGKLLLKCGSVIRLLLLMRLRSFHLV